MEARRSHRPVRPVAIAQAPARRRRSAFRRFRTWALAATLLASLVTAYANGPPVVESSHQDDAVVIRATAELRADRATAWRVLTDYERYPAFIPDLAASRIVARTGPVVTVEQRGSALLGPLRLPIEVTFRIVEHPPDSLESRAVAGSLRALESRYALLAATDGGTRLVYTGRIEAGFPLFDTLERAVVEANVARQFRALVDEIERHAADAPPDAPVGPGGLRDTPRPARRDR